MTCRIKVGSSARHADACEARRDAGVACLSHPHLRRTAHDFAALATAAVDGPEARYYARLAGHAGYHEGLSHTADCPFARGELADEWVYMWGVAQRADIARRGGARAAAEAPAPPPIRLPYADD